MLKTDAGGNVLHRYLHGPGHDEIFADEDALNEVLWALADHQGTVKDWIEHDAATGTTTVANHLEYDAYGNIISQTDPSHTPPVGFTGQDWDADVGLYYYSAGIPGGRWYDPVAGRFLKPDGAGFAAGDANLYRYVGNGPGNWVDPTGMQPPLLGFGASQLGRQAGTAFFTAPGGDYFDRNFGGPTYGGPDLSGKVIGGAGTVAEFAPIAGEIGGAGQTILGRDYNGNPLSTEERVATGVGTILPYVPGSTTRKFFKCIPDRFKRNPFLGTPTTRRPSVDTPLPGGVTGEVPPDPRTGGGYGVNDPPVRVDGPWTDNDLKQALLGHPPRGLGSPDLHHAGQMPGSGVHEVLPNLHRNNPALHPNRFNQGVTPEMRTQDRQLHWWYRAREQGADQCLPDWIYDN